MKTRVLFSLSLFCVVAITSTSAQSASQSLTDEVMARWITSLQTENIEGYAACYWPDATLFSYNPGNTSTFLEGVDAIRSNQNALFSAFDFPSMNLTYPEAKRFWSADDVRSIYVYDNREKYRFVEIIYLEKRSGEYKIVNQVLATGLAPAATQ